MKTKGKLIAGTLAIMTVGVLLSFAVGEGSSEKEDGKMKKYQVLHHADGKMVEYDTLIPNNSTYTVEAFLADKGIESENVEIITIPSISDHVMLKEFHHDGEFHHSMENVMITVEVDDEGNTVAKKIVNGEEVELSEEEIADFKNLDLSEDELVDIKKLKLSVEELTDIKTLAHGDNVRVIIDKIHEEGDHANETHERGDHQMVEIMVEIDNEGNKTVKKTVNGEEVELTEGEIIEIESHGHGEHEVEMIIEIENEEMEDGEKRVIIREMEFNSDELEDHEIIVIDKIAEDEDSWFSEDHTNINYIHAEGVEDFTIVLVTENIDAGDVKSMELDSKINPTTIYPNPNDGVFTINFDQPNKAKTKIEITDIEGRVVFEEDLGKYSGLYNKEVNLKEFGAGMYMIAIQQGNERTVNKVMVK